MIDLTAEAALVADTSLLVRARFVEAADTMAHVSVRGTRPSETSSFWPAYTPEMIDPDRGPRYRPSSAAISRADEVMQDWLLDFLPDQEHRILTARWAACLAVPQMAGSFRSFCRKSGRNRTTAERRIDVAFQGIARKFLNSSRLLRDPDWSRVMPMLPEWGSEIDMVAERVTERMTYWRAEDAVPVHRPEVR